MTPFHRLTVGGVLILLLVAVPASAGKFTLFESGQVRPLALSPDGTTLFAVNTPDDRLEVLSVGAGGLTRLFSVPVGLEPVAVAARTDGEVWVVNHLSDSVSVVDVSDPAAARVVRTLLVGDEPRDIVFAGPARDRAFVTTAHRGQNRPDDPQLTTAGVGRADVWVFDANDLGASLGGNPLTIVTLFGDTPRALAVSPDGLTVYAAVFESGNRTTAITQGLVPFNNPLPPPRTNFQGISQPPTGLIVKFDGLHWTDELGRSWDDTVKFSLPDEDVFAIDAAADPPAQVAGAAGFFSGVGTILFDMAVNPVSGAVYVSNTDALNEVRFEGPGSYAHAFKPPGEPASVRGHLHESRITVLSGGSVVSRHLNPHISYGTCCAPGPNAENDKSLAFPLGMAVSGDGQTLYVAAFGSGKIGVFDTGELEAGTFVPSTADHVVLSAGGPTGVVLDEAHARLYVLTRFDDGISTVSTTSRTETAHLRLHDPEPASVTNGRRFLYDARFTSSHGDSACASCHVFGDFDSLAWDLGNPDEVTLTNPGPINVDAPFGDNPDFRPLKGPMTTQSLRGMANAGPMHWRGDRTGGNDAPSEQPDAGTFDENAAFGKFNVAFAGLLGRSGPLTAFEMQQFTNFILQVTYPPNPVRALDNSLTPEEQSGRNFYFGGISDTFRSCNQCHVLDLAGNREFGVAAPGFFGTDGQYTFENETQFFKIPHLRNMYQKVGMFGMAASGFFNAGDNDPKGDQVRGFGFLHDGSVDTLFRFHNATAFNLRPVFPFGNPFGFPAGPEGDVLRRDMEAFMLAFDSNLAPIVGQQITRTSTNGAVVDPRIDLLTARANAGECDLVAKASIGGEERGFVYGSGRFLGDRASDPLLTPTALRALAATPGQEQTYSCVPPGSGGRFGVDRDGDGIGDGDERDAGTDPADAASVPAGSPTICSAFTTTTFKTATLKDKTGKLSMRGDLVLGSYDNGTVRVEAFDNGGTIFAGQIPGYAFIASRRSFRYKAYSGASGLTTITLRRTSTPGLFRVSLRAIHGWTPVKANETIASTFVRLNVGGQCFQSPATSVR